MNPELIIEMNKIAFYKLNGVNVGTALTLICENKISSWRQIFVAVVRPLFVFQYKIYKYGRGVLTFIFDSHNCRRDDHLKAFLNFSKLFSDRMELICPSSHNKKFKMSNILYYRFVLIWYLQIQHIEAPIRDKLYICLYLLRTYIEEKNIESYIDMCSTKGIIVYFDIPAHCSILVQKMKRKVFTATLQHGHYEPDSIMYRSSCSEFFGANTNLSNHYAINVGLMPNKIFVTGLLQELGKPELGITRTNAFGIVLDGGEGECNEILLEFGKKIQALSGMHCFVRCHPGRKKIKLDSNFLDGNRFQTIGKFLENMEFIISCYSTVCLEALYYLKPCFRYIGKKDNFPGLEDNRFSNINELIKLFKEYYSLDFTERLKDIKKNYIGDNNCEYVKNTVLSLIANYKQE